MEPAPEHLPAHYRLVRKLGDGGMGEVYLAEDTRLDRKVALKFLPAGLAQDPHRRQRFLAEAKAASALNHPNICVVHEVGETDHQRMFIVMEFVEGRTLDALIREGGLGIEEMVAIGVQVADALEAAHSRGIVHRDIKPSNMSVNARGQVKVLDFGLAKRLGQGESGVAEEITQAATLAGQVLGTPSYMSPEQALGREVDGRSDLFSLGVVLYELVSGRAPFTGTSIGDTIHRIVHAHPEAMARFNYDVPPELDRVVRKCLEKPVDRRYQSARELWVDLRNLQRDLAAQAPGGVPAAGSAAFESAPATGAPATISTALSQSDLFITCARVDDEPMAAEPGGWISRFQRHLEVRLEQLAGEHISVGRLAGDRAMGLAESNFAPVLGRAKAVISVVSPPFVKSDGCRRVVETFWQAAERSGGLWIQNHPRLFKVTKTPVAPQEIPPGLAALFAQLNSFDFYEEDPETGRIREFDERFGPEARQRYFERVYDVAQELHRVWQALKSSGTGGAPPLPRSGKVVYLALCSSDLQPDTDRIRRELVARGHEVLPDRPLPLVGAELESAIGGYLARSELALHPVGSFYGMIPEGTDCSLIELQNRLAAQSAATRGLRRIIWLPRQVEPRDARQERFLRELRENPEFHRGAEIIQDNVEALKALVVDRLAPRPPTHAGGIPPRKRAGPLRVYLVCDRGDEGAVEPLEDFLFDQGFEVSLPDFEADEAAAAETHRQNLVDCDAAIVFYGAARHSWLDIKLRSLLKASGYGRPDPIGVQLVYVASPFDRRKERYRTHTAEVVRQEGEFQPALLASFVERVRKLEPHRG